MKKILAFIQNNFISCICLFLAATIFTSAVTFSKFVSTGGTTQGSTTGSFHCSGSVDDVSSLSFANLDFWGGTEKDTPMNTIHSLDFLVNNYEEKTVGESVIKYVSATKIGYTLIFSAPAIFLDKLAFQLYESPNTVMTPQIVLADLLATANGGTYDTAKSIDYKGDPYPDFQFKINVSNKSVANTYTATAALPNGTGDMVLKVEPFTQEITQTLKFRLWDVSKLTSASNPTVEYDSGELITPLYADVHADVLCYRISLSMPQFQLAAGVEEQDKYSIRFVTTSAINDRELGGFLMENQDGESLKSIYSEKTAYMRMMTETDTYTDADGKVLESNSYYVLGNPRAYTEGTNTTTNRSEQKEGTYEKTTTKTGTTSEYIYFDKDGNIKQSSEVQSGDYRMRVSSGASYTETTTTTYNVEKMVTTNTQTITTTIEKPDSKTEIIKQKIDVGTTREITLLNGDTKVETVRTYELPNRGAIQKRNGNNSWSNVTDTEVLPERLTEKTSETGSVSELTFTETLPMASYKRTVERVTSYAQSITFDKVYRRTEDLAGNSAEKEYMDASDAFELFDSNNIQQYFLSQCYSKSYPLKVNVYFEQLQK